MLSETCKDLLKRLLERNPLTRITFDEFFSHPFVDLDHMASSSSYPQAVTYSLLFLGAGSNLKLFVPILIDRVAK